MVQGYAVFKDRCGPTHYLLIPTRRRPGVESAHLLDATEPDYFALAWSERGHSRAADTAPGALDEDIGLAVNSRFGRSQSQLHVHIDRVRPEVRAALRALGNAAGPATEVHLVGHVYRVAHRRAIDESAIAWAMAAWGARDEEERSRVSVALVGDGAGGYFYLAGHADLAQLDRGHAEELLVPRSCEAS